MSEVDSGKGEEPERADVVDWDVGLVHDSIFE